ncbi:SDR family NAD(P)-dependent oxidoreductase [Stakelama tenebrarum]|uniref:SDR family oxidoreductase n=1 Tax=Stakelama tenebrarum TaxID=2711215 RepID=A0A6G6Y6T9_9SPHN|nr:SDR family NAD(P)-dependent oxidoreductase [Sphingosinithalassobacter tenebrarum]QIG80652.1 SDR family oxidoreductase [Sphingosinithalassobacter tenebrarum]
MDLGLAGANVCIVGASRGIGKATAKRFAQEGANVALLARSEKSLEKSATACRELGSGEVLTSQCDMTDGDAVKAAFATIGEKFGSLNVLINNAANSVGTHGAFAKFDDEELYLEAYNRITLGYVRTTRAALPLLRKADWGRIVNVSSISTTKPQPMLHVYNMVKSALNSWSQAMARELGEDNILVNVMSPGAIMVESGNWGEIMNGYFEKYGLDPKSPQDAFKLSKLHFGAEDSVWTNRYGYTDEYARVLTFMGSKANSYMSGANINVDGGTNFHW